jgi:hypothetical protein
VSRDSLPCGLSELPEGTLVTDEQAARDGGEVSAAVPGHVPVYTWNLAGYARGHAPSGFGTRHAFGGLTDHAFRLIPVIEAGRDARWDDLFATGAAGGE